MTWLYCPAISNLVQRFNPTFFESKAPNHWYIWNQKSNGYIFSNAYMNIIIYFNYIIMYYMLCKSSTMHFTCTTHANILYAPNTAINTQTCPWWHVLMNNVSTVQIISLFHSWPCWGTWGTWSVRALVRLITRRSSADWPIRWDPAEWSIYYILIVKITFQLLILQFSYQRKSHICVCCLVSFGIKLNSFFNLDVLTDGRYSEPSVSHQIPRCLQSHHGA